MLIFQIFFTWSICSISIKCVLWTFYFVQNVYYIFNYWYFYVKLKYFVFIVYPIVSHVTIQFNSIYSFQANWSCQTVLWSWPPIIIQTYTNVRFKNKITKNTAIITGTQGINSRNKMLKSQWTSKREIIL
jgi:hypothetical protein